MSAAGSGHCQWAQVAEGASDFKFQSWEPQAASERTGTFPVGASCSKPEAPSPPSQPDLDSEAEACKLRIVFFVF